MLREISEIVNGSIRPVNRQHPPFQRIAPAQPKHHRVIVSWGRASSRSKSPTPHRFRRASTPTKDSARFCSSSPTRPQKPATPTAGANTSHRRGLCCRSCRESRGNLVGTSRGGNLRGSALAIRFRTLTVARLAAFAFFVNVFDRRLVDHQIRLAAVSYHLEAVLVVPLDDAVNLLAVAEHDDQWGLRLHLFLIIKILGVGLLRGREFLSAEALPLSARALRTLV